MGGGGIDTPRQRTSFFAAQRLGQAEYGVVALALWRSLGAQKSVSDRDNENADPRISGADGEIDRWR